MTERSQAATRAASAYHPEIEFLPRQALDALQGSLLAQAVRQARGAPFFRERLAAFEDVPDLLPLARFQECVPLTTKQDLREARESAWVTAARDHVALMLATSGTTGSRIPLPYTLQDQQQWHALVARTLWANGLRPWDITLLPVPIGLFTGGHAMLGGLLRLGCTVVPIGMVPPPVIIEAFRGAFGPLPTAVVTLPTYLLRLLDALPGLGYDPSSCPLRIGSLGAESWSEAARQRIEEGFGLRAVDSYGIGELCGPGVAAECECREGMHVWEDAFLVEVVDHATGEPVPDGTPGEMVLTSLFREVLPLLRYRTGDETRILPEPCACGRTHRRIARITRRLDNVLIVTGVNIDPGDIEQLLYRLPWLGNEFVLDVGGSNRDALEVYLERNPRVPAPPESEAEVIREIRRHFPVRVIVHLHEPGHLERNPGKAQRIRGS